MENPLHNQLDVPLSLSASVPDGAISDDCPTPGVECSPVEVEIRDMNDCQRSHRQRVTLGERQTLLARRNAAFVARRCTGAYVASEENPTTETQDTSCVDPPTQPGVANNEDPSSTSQPANITTSPTRSSVNEDGDDEAIFEEDTNEEDYMFTGQDGDNDDDVEFDEADYSTVTASSVSDPYDHVYSNIPQRTHVLKPQPNCEFCDAKKFECEPKGFCCRNGKISLSNPDTPPELMRLWSSADSDAKHFRDSIRFFNGHFSFTSLYCRLDSETTNMATSGIYTFRAHGQMYHNIHSFGGNGLDPQHLEMYFYDDDPSLEHRYRRCREKQYRQDQEVIARLVGILRDNPYSQHFRSMGQVEDLEDYRVTLNLDNRLDQRTYNVPLTSEVAAVWVEGSEQQKNFDCSVILHGNNNETYGVRPYHACYDPLSYPLFFPRGEIGWHPDIPKVGVSMDAARAARGNNNEDPDSNSRLCVSVRDYYCYKFQMRPGIFNPILFGKRLFQQFVVDTYIKIESSRLDYIWNHQKEIRADLYQGLVDSFNAGESRANAVGKRTVLATSFIGGPRDMRRRCMDAMALVRKYGKPDVFLTMTCNPNWEEIRVGSTMARYPRIARISSCVFSGRSSRN
ncbi:uncharacterized protein LOC133910810 [Phragmites australis]|uniref:uncharacterized protein LOC133910810 n=1 Tax=Phragmites australis TaxID=29695 RepID=UPI002D79CE3E|nr:uncharacterized protein LOC133910810 [Phragmites australis]